MKWLLTFIVLVVLGGGFYYLQMGNNLGMQNDAGSGLASGISPSGALGTNEGSATAAKLIVATGTSEIPNILTADNGMTLYTYSPDTATPGASSCGGQCAVNWPPYTITAGTNLTAADGITGEVSTITRADDTVQVTYNGAPLYFYIKDKVPGDKNGNNVGGVWFFATP